MRPAAAERKGGRFALRVSLLFAAIFLMVGITLPYLPLWLDWVGLNAREIAIVTAAPLLARTLAAPAIAYAADCAGAHRRLLIALAWASFAALIALAEARRFAAILPLSLIFSLAWTGVLPLTETIAMRGVKAGLDYGHMRLWGSLSFIGASLFGGWALAGLGPGYVLWLVSAAAVLSAAAAHALPRCAPRESGAGRLGPLADVVPLIFARDFLLFLVAAGSVQGAHAVLYAFSTLHWRALGLSTTRAGALWAISIVSEVALFTCARRVVRHIGAARLIVLGAAAAVIRWAAMGFDPPFLLLLALQALHGLTFAATHLGAMHFIARTVSDARAATAQALYAAATSGIFMAVAILSAGPLYAAYAGRAYWAMAAMAAVGLAAGLLLVATGTRPAPAG
jgi:MFS transporter, PPP family, 3-phenylpropionic acid transporter